MGSSKVAWTIVLVVLLGAAFVTNRPGVGAYKSQNIVNNMKSCLDERKATDHGDGDIAYSHRICWMRAQRG